MSRSRLLSIPTLVLAFLALLLASPVWASPAATLEVEPGFVSWSVAEDALEHYLVVEGPTGRIEQHFGAGEVPSLALSADGTPLADGLYSWELRAWGPVRERGAAPTTSQRRDSRVALGHFTVDGGLFVVPQVEPEAASRANPSSGEGTLATRDILYIDDVIIDSNACVGTGCVNGESFGTDVLRLKDINNRIHLQDVSTSTYPTNDWRITVNSDVAGGANFFSIDDVDGGATPFTLEAGARDASIYVDSTDRVGFGTGTPAEDLHVVTGDSPTLRLEQDGSSDFSPHTWDITANEANFFIEDVSSGNNLPFRIRPEAPTNALYIEEDGKIGLGTDNPGTALHLRRTDGTANLLVQEASTTVATRSLFEIRNPGATQFTINNTNAGVVWRMANNGRFTLLRVRSPDFGGPRNPRHPDRDVRRRGQARDRSRRPRGGLGGRRSAADQHLELPRQSSRAPPHGADGAGFLFRLQVGWHLDRNFSA